MFRNCWYPVAYSSDLRETREFDFLDGQIKLVRSKNGDVEAFPSQSLLEQLGEKRSEFSAETRLARLEVVQKFGLIFVFMSLAKADPESCPLFEIGEYEDPLWHACSGQFRWDVDFTRALENAIDVSHPHMVHPRTFGNPRRPEVNILCVEKSTWSGNQSSRFFPPDNFFQSILRRGKPDAVTRVAFHFPNVTRLDVSLPGMSIVIVSFHTPIRAGVTQTFWLIFRDSFRWRCLDSVTRSLVMQTFREDERIVVAQFPKRSPFLGVGELSFRDDVLQLHFRSLCKKFKNLGWLID